jgi:general secretion pathway protein G
MKKIHDGYTMIELLVVMTIILILGTLGFIAYGYASASGRDSRRKSDLEQIRSAMEFYRSDFGYYPGTATQFTSVSTALTDLVATGYISSLPSDPKGDQTYDYQIIMSDLRGTNYYAYCLSAKLETTQTVSSNCGSTTLPTDYTYGIKNP